MDSLKENHLGTLILLVISLSGLTFYAIAETIHRQPWGTLCAFLGFGAFVCFMCLMPLLHRRISLYRIGRDLETQRSQESFSLDQSNSTSLIDITCRLQTCRKRTNIQLILTSILTVVLIAGAVVTHSYSEDALAMMRVQKEDSQAVMRVQKEDAILAQQIEAEKIQAITQEIETAVFNEIELQRTALLINIKNTMINLLTTELDPSDRLSKELKTCKKSPNRCFRVESQGLSYLLDDYTTQQNRYKNALNEIMAHKLDELLKQSIHSITSEHESTIATLQQTWIQKADQDFFEFYNTINQIRSKTKYMKAIDSAKIKDTKTREVIAQMFYLELLEKAIQSQPEFSTSHTTHTHLIVFTSQFETETKRKYKDEDFDGPKAVRVRIF